MAVFWISISQGIPRLCHLSDFDGQLGRPHLRRLSDLEIQDRQRLLRRFRHSPSSVFFQSRNPGQTASSLDYTVTLRSCSPCQSLVDYVDFTNKTEQH